MSPDVEGAAGPVAGGNEPLDRHERLRQRRRERLLAVLPRIFAAQPEGSTVALLLNALAGRLADLDEATERVLRDRWVALAGGEPHWNGGPHPLDRMGALVNLTREPWEGDDAFRLRLRQTASVLVRGSTTARSVLTVAAAAMNTELCRRLTRLPEGLPPERQDTTLGIAMRPGTVAKCPGCATPGKQCLYEERRANGPLQGRLLLTDNPSTPRSLRVSSLSHGAAFQVRNPSLVADRPTLVLRALEDVHYPALRNVMDREVMVFAGRLQAGETLTIIPRRDEEEVQPFDGYNPGGPVLQWRTAPEGGAFVLDAEGHRHLVSEKVLFLRAAPFGGPLDTGLFEGARFAGPQPAPTASRFSLLDRALLTPRLDVGQSTWTYQSYTQRDFDALAAPALAKERDEAPTEAGTGRVELTLEWWARPPATFRVRIPEMPALGASEQLLVKELVQRMVSAVRPAGVSASVDFPAPPEEEEHALGENPFGAALTVSLRELQLATDALALHTTASFQEQQPQQETRVSMGGVFGMTRLDWSHLA